MLVLVVEDEPVIAMLYTHYLTGAGHTVLGPAARVFTALALAAESRPDLALVDINLPDGSGVDLARQLKQCWDVPCLFLTAEPETGRKARDAALGVLSKPCGEGDILGSIRTVAQLSAGEVPTDPPPQLELFNRPGSTRH